MERFEMEHQLASPNHRSALKLWAVVHLGPETLVPAANPIHRLTVIVVLTPVDALVQLSGNCPYLGKFEIVRLKELRDVELGGQYKPDEFQFPSPNHSLARRAGIFRGFKPDDLYLRPFVVGTDLPHLHISGGG